MPRRYAASESSRLKCPSSIRASSASSSASAASELSGGVASGRAGLSFSCALRIAKLLLRRADAGQHIIHRSIFGEGKTWTERRITESGNHMNAQMRSARGGGQLRRTDKPCIVMSAARQYAKQIFRSDDRKQIGFRRAVQSCKKDPSAGFHKRCACRDDGGGIGYMLKHFHACHDIIVAGFARCQRFCAHFFIIHRYACLKPMQLSSAERLGA